MEQSFINCASNNKKNIDELIKIYDDRNFRINGEAVNESFFSKFNDPFTMILNLSKYLPKIEDLKENIMQEDIYICDKDFFKKKILLFPDLFF